MAMPVSRCERCRDAFFGMHAGLCLRCDDLVSYTEANGRARQAEAARKGQLERWARKERAKLRAERAAEMPA
jgi:hypothetical protein